LSYYHPEGPLVNPERRHPSALGLLHSNALINRDKRQISNMNRLVLLFFILALAACEPASELRDYSELDIEALQTLMEQGELTSERLTEFYLDRIASIDRNRQGAGPGTSNVWPTRTDARDTGRPESEHRHCR
jgi:hypothetical protein